MLGLWQGLVAASRTACAVAQIFLSQGDQTPTARWRSVGVCTHKSGTSKCGLEVRSSPFRLIESNDQNSTSGW
jgi:hypothetical protein